MNKKNLLATVLIALIIITATYSIKYFYNQQPLIRIKASTTTSLYATGLLDYLADKFRINHSNVILQFISVGSGAALRLAEQGDVEIVFVHAPNLEKDYIERGIIMNHTIFAYNYFIIIGPESDPANIVNLTPVEAMKKIYDACEAGKALFVSRGDQSGTHQRELLLWNLSGLSPFNKKWYIETGSGMSETLLVANEKKAYTISDMGTYLKLKKEGRLPNIVKLIDKGKILLNIYSVYIVQVVEANSEVAKLINEIIGFITSDYGQDLIGLFGVSDYGQPLFYPARGNESELQSAWEWFANLS